MYPVHIQACRVTGTSTPGPTDGGSSGPGPVLYVAFTQQLRSDLLTPRDREACLVYDLNGTTLVAGYYICRLVGSYSGLPLYATMAKATSGTSIESLNDNYLPHQTIGITDDVMDYPVVYGDNTNEMSMNSTTDPAITQLDLWVNDRRYHKGWLVRHGGLIWRAETANVGVTPTVSDSTWANLSGDGLIVLSIPKGHIYTPDGQKAIAGGNSLATPTPVPLGPNFNFKTANSNLIITSDSTTSDVTYNVKDATVTIINIANITNFNTYVENVIYFNFFDKKIYINVNNFWYSFCICGSGEGSGGSGTGLGSVVTDCCPDTLLPTTLYGTITAKTGGCTCLPTTLAFEYVGDSRWTSAFITTCSYEGVLHLDCSGGVWSLGNASVATGTLISTVCDPLEIVFDMTGDPATCTGTFTVTITT